MCLECTCGGTDAKLETRAAACVNGACGDCGFGRCWTRGLRPFLIDRVERADGSVEYEGLKEDVPSELLKTMRWENYAYRLKTTEGKKTQGRGRGSSRAAAADGADEDGAWEADVKSN